MVFHLFWQQESLTLARFVVVPILPFSNLFLVGRYPIFQVLLIQLKKLHDCVKTTFARLAGRHKFCLCCVATTNSTGYPLQKNDDGIEIEWGCSCSCSSRYPSSRTQGMFLRSDKNCDKRRNIPTTGSPFLLTIPTLIFCSLH
jgi:hypothetical protein